MLCDQVGLVSELEKLLLVGMNHFFTRQFQKLVIHLFFNRYILTTIPVSLLKQNLMCETDK